MADYKSLIGRVKVVSSSDLAINPREKVRINHAIQEVSTINLGTSRLAGLPNINWSDMGHVGGASLREINSQWNLRGEESEELRAGLIQILQGVITTVTKTDEALDGVDAGMSKIA